MPKGGIVLWDSRTAHDNIPPELGRPNSDRWRFVVFVSMTPAKWTNPESLAIKQEAYDGMKITTHWSSQGLKTFNDFNPKAKKNKIVDTITELPDVAKTREAKLLFGILPYDFTDGKPNGPDLPKWND